MEIDDQDASIGLTDDEVGRLRNDDVFRRRVERVASDLHDQSDRTVLIMSPTFSTVAHYDDEGWSFD